jgi:hypothetical protein
MAEFIFTYRTPADCTLGTPDGIAAWNAWFQGLGSQLRDPGKPVSDRATVGDSGDGARLGGYSLVTAENLDEALTLAKGCPIVAAGGGSRSASSRTCAADGQHDACGKQLRDRQPRCRGAGLSRPAHGAFRRFRAPGNRWHPPF